MAAIAARRWHTLSMLRRSARPATLATLLVLAGCGQQLGHYEVKDLRLVGQYPPFERGSPPNRPYDQFIRIELSSQTSLQNVETGPGLYVEATFCSADPDRKLIAFGPLGRNEKKVANQGAPLARDPRDGLFHYLIYLVPNAPARRPYGNSDKIYPAYDLRSDPEAVCLEFFVPGYNLVPSRSAAFTLSKAQIQAVLPDENAP